MDKFDIAIIGGGPGGYVAAIRASQLGRKVALIEMDHLGGTCLNRGCIPSKTLLRHAEVIDQIKKAKSWGIETGALTFSFDKMMDRKDAVIQTLRSGIAALLKKGQITHYHGKAELDGQNAISIHTEFGGKVNIQAEKVIVATGSVPFVPRITGIEEMDFYTSDTIFELTDIPRSIAIIGGGVIGVEFASIFASLNVDVTVIEMGSRLVPSEDEEAAKLLRKTLKKKKVRVLTEKKVSAMKQDGATKQLIVESTNGSLEQIDCEVVLVAVGRKPNLSAVYNLSLQMEGPFIKTNKFLETSQSGVYAVGDLIGGYQLAHMASAEGIIAAENAAGQRHELDVKVVPRCIYTSPEIASVGMSEEEVRQSGKQYRIAKYALSGNGKAIAMDETEGFVKIIVEEKYGEILGVVMAGAHVTEMISQASAFIYLEGTVEELAQMIQPHPALSEMMLEVASSWLEKGIHS